MPFVEPETLASFERCQNGQREQLRFEHSEFQGRPVYTLRLYWQNDAGEWRWSPARPSSTGRHWASLSLKPTELHLLGTALIAEAAELERVLDHPRAGPPPRRRNAKEQAELDRFDRENRPLRLDPSIPF